MDLINVLNSVPAAGYRVVAACCGDSEEGSIGQVPVVGDESEAAEVAQRIGANTVACTSSARFDAGGLRHLGWALEGRDVDLVVAPRLTDVAGPRVLTRPVAGLSLLHVESPVFAGPRLAAKTTIDRGAAALLLILLSPLFAVVAARIRRGDHGPVFFQQERIGKDGTSFPMLKFRTMLVGAEAALPSLLDRSEGQGPLFKLSDDPRITRVGATLRRYSLDELPQLLNVLRGEMSLVGPRPPLPCEVETYGNERSQTTARQTRYDRPLADQRAQQSVVGRIGPLRPVLRGELVCHVRPDDDAASLGRRGGGKMGVRPSGTPISL